jgi:predicted aspartyl protease
MKRTILLALSVVGLSSTLSAQSYSYPVSRPTGDTPVRKDGQAEDVRFKNGQDDRMTVAVRLSGSGPYRFLVDTGADRTAISRELAAKLNLVAGNPAALHSVTGVSTVATAALPGLVLTRKSLNIANAPLLESVNMGADGILGVDSLKSQRVVFDFVGQTMLVEPSGSLEPLREPDSIVIQARRRGGRLILTDASANGHQLTVVVDTGSQVSIGNDALRRQLMARELVDPVQQIELISVTGEKIVGSYMFIRKIALGGVELKNLAVVFADAHTFKQLKLEDKPALLLGMNAMRAFKKVSIDFANRKFKVVLPESSALDLRLASAVN